MSGTIHHLIISALVSQQPSSFQSRVVPQTWRVPLFYSLPSTSLLTSGVFLRCPPPSSTPKVMCLRAPWELPSSAFQRTCKSSDRTVPSDTCVLSRFSCVWLFVTPWTVAHQAPLSMGFSRQEYWSLLPFPGALPNRGIKPGPPVAPALQVDSLPLSQV